MRPRVLASSLALLCGVIQMSPASAAAVRTFVASTGTDTGGCSRAAPCRSFAYAVTQTAAGGELVALDSAGYGAATITQAISIVNTAGNLGSIAVPAGQNGITISAGETDNVVLRGLTFEGANAGANGIVFNSGGGLTVQDCILQNFVGTTTAGNGILLAPSSGNPTFLITNTTTSNTAVSGLQYLDAGGSVGSGVTVKVDRMTNYRTNYAVMATATSPVQPDIFISNTISSKYNYGFYFRSVVAILDRAEANGGGTGVYSENSTVYFTNSVAQFNGTDVKIASGYAASAGNNLFGSVTGTLNPLTLK